MGEINTSFKIDERLNQKLRIGSNVELDANTKEIFYRASFGVAEELSADNFDPQLLPVNCIFTSHGNLTLETDDNIYGMAMGLIVYPVKRWEDAELS